MHVRRNSRQHQTRPSTRRTRFNICGKTRENRCFPLEMRIAHGDSLSGSHNILTMNYSETHPTAIYFRVVAKLARSARAALLGRLLKRLSLLPLGLRLCCPFLVDREHSPNPGAPRIILDRNSRPLENPAIASSTLPFLSSESAELVGHFGALPIHVHPHEIGGLLALSRRLGGLVLFH